MKNAKIKIMLTLLLSCGTMISSKTEAESLKVIWTFYNADYDMTVHWNPATHNVTYIEWNGHNPTNILDDTAATYSAIDDVLYMTNFQVYDDVELPLVAGWRNITGPFERQ